MYIPIHIMYPILIHKPIHLYNTLFTLYSNAYIGTYPLKIFNVTIRQLPQTVFIITSCKLSQTPLILYYAVP